MPVPASTTVDISGGPVPSGQLRPDDLLLERYTKEAERLARQAEPTSQIAKGLEQAVQQIRSMTQSFETMSERVTTLSRALADAFTGAVDAVRNAASGVSGVTGGRPAGQAGIAGQVITGALAGSIIAGMARQIPTTAIQQVQEQIVRQIPPQEPVKQTPVTSSAPIPYEIRTRPPRSLSDRSRLPRLADQKEQAEKTTLTEQERQLASDIQLEQVEQTPTPTPSTPPVAPADPTDTPTAPVDTGTSAPMPGTGPVSEPTPAVEPPRRYNVRTEGVGAPSVSRTRIPGLADRIQRLTVPPPELPPLPPEPVRGDVGTPPVDPGEIQTSKTGKVKTLAGGWADPGSVKGKEAIDAHQKLKDAYQKALQDYNDNAKRMEEEYQAALKEHQRLVAERAALIAKQSPVTLGPPITLTTTRTPVPTAPTIPPVQPTVPPIPLPTSPAITPPAIPPVPTPGPTLTPPVAPPVPPTPPVTPPVPPLIPPAGGQPPVPPTPPVTPPTPPAPTPPAPTTPPTQRSIEAAMRREIRSRMRAELNKQLREQRAYQNILASAFNSPTSQPGKLFEGRQDLNELTNFNAAREARVNAQMRIRALEEPETGATTRSKMTGRDAAIATVHEQLMARGDVAEQRLLDNRLMEEFRYTPSMKYAQRAEFTQGREKEVSDLLNQLDMQREQQIYAESPEGETSYRTEAIRRRQSALMTRNQQIQASRYDADLRGSPLDKEDVTSRFTQGRQQETFDLRNQIDLAKEKQRWISTPQGRAALREERDINRELMTVNRSNRYRELIATQGELGGRLQFVNENLKAQGITLEGISHMASRAFVGISAGIMGAVSQGDPVAYQTFRRSIEGLAMAIGEQFGPAVLRAAGYIQNLTTAYDATDQSTKNFITRSALVVMGLSGVAMVLPRVITLLRSLGTMMTFSMATGPWTLGLIGLAAVVGSVGAAWLAVRDNAEDAGRAMRESSHAVSDVRGIGPGGVTERRDTRQEFTRLMEVIPRGSRRRIEAIGEDPERVREGIQAERERIDAELAQARAALAAAGGTRASERRVEVERADSIMGRYGEILQDRLRRLPPVNPRDVTPQEGETRPQATMRVVRERSNQAAREAAEEAVRDYIRNAQRFGTFNMPAAQQETLAQRLLNRSGYGATDRNAEPESPAIRDANRWVEVVIRAQNNLRQLAELAGSTGGAGSDAGGPLKSWRGLLPQAQSFSNFAQFGEQLQIKALESWGPLDMLNEMRRTNTILESIGTSINGIMGSYNPTAGLSEIFRFFGTGRNR